MNRDKQIEFADGAEKCHEERSKRLLSNANFTAMLVQYDHEVLPAPQKVAARG